MKRIWFAVIFLIIACIACIGEQIYIKSFYNSMTALITEAEKYSDSEEKAEKIKALQNYWKDKNGYIFTLTNHGVLDELSTEIRALNEASTVKDLERVEAILNVFFENQKITFSNIF